MACLRVGFKKSFPQKGDFLKLKTEVRRIILFYQFVFFCSKKIENRRKSRRQFITCQLTSSFDDNKKCFQELRNMAVVEVYISKYKLLKIYYQSYVDSKLFWLVQLYCQGQFQNVTACVRFFRKKAKKEQNVRTNGQTCTTVARNKLLEQPLIVANISQQVAHLFGGFQN